jgi:hypothetical protein
VNLQSGEVRVDIIREKTPFEKIWVKYEPIGTQQAHFGIRRGVG